MTTTNKTLEQLRAEAEAAHTALAEAQRAEAAKAEEVKRAERAAKYEAEQKAELAKRQAIKDRVIAALVGVEGGAALVRVEQTFSKVNSWRSVPNGYAVTVETISGPARRFPVKPDGSCNLPKIIDAVKEQLSYKAAAKARAEAEAARKASSGEIASRLNAEFGADRTAAAIRYYVPIGSRTESRESIASPGKVFVKLGNLDCTEEQARIMLEALNRAFPK